MRYGDDVLNRRLHWLGIDFGGFACITADGDGRGNHGRLR